MEESNIDTAKQLDLLNSRAFRANKRVMCRVDIRRHLEKVMVPLNMDQKPSLGNPHKIYLHLILQAFLFQQAFSPPKLI